MEWKETRLDDGGCGECDVKEDERSCQSQLNSVGEGVMTCEVGGNGIERKEVA